MRPIATRIAQLGLLGALALVLAMPALAQRTVVIEPGPPGTFNNRIAADITAGTAANTTYVLRRGAIYLYNAQLLIPVSLNIVAEDGTGARPVIQAAFSTSQAPRPLRISGAGVTVNVKGLYFYGLDNIGADTDNATIRVAANDVTLNVDDCHFDANRLTSLQADNDGISMTITNSIFSNVFNLATQFGYAIFIQPGRSVRDFRIVNTTFYNNNGITFLNAGNADLVEIRHVTFHNTGNALDFNDVVDIGVADRSVLLDNIVYNGGYYGNTPARPFRYVVSVDTVFADTDMNPATPPVAQPVQFNFGNANIYFDPAITASYPDSVSQRPLYDNLPAAYLAQNPDRAATIFSERLAFTNAPSTAAVIARLAYYYQNRSEQGAPFLDRDPRDPANTPATPGTTTADQLPVDFGYPTSARSYTAASNGCPLGDLRWFPGVDMTACLTVASAAGPANVASLNVRTAPNPATAAAVVLFDLDAAADVMVTIHDLLGREVASQQLTLGAGADQRVRLDVSSLPSGLYVYRVRTDDGTAVRTATGRVTVVR